MEDKDRKYAIELEVITPLSVGAGNDNDWMRGIDYVQKDGNVYVLDIRKVSEQGIDIDRLTTLFEKSDENGICSLIGGKLKDVSKYVFKAPAPTNNSIKTFLRTQLYGKPVVAGSSIKGSVRSALFHYLREREEETNEAVFGNMKDGTDLMRFIRIADIEMPSTTLVNTKIFNLRKEGAEWAGGWKHGMNETTRQFRSNGFNTLYECVIPGKKGFGSISLAGGAFQLLANDKDKYISYSAKKRQLFTDGIQGLFHIINEVTRTYLLKEKAFFEKFPADRSEELIDNVNTLLKMIPDDDSYCLLKMSAGVGFHSITGDWRFDDYSQDRAHTVIKRGVPVSIPYKSRKTAEWGRHLQLMGFVKLRALSADEVGQYMQTLNTEHAEILDRIIVPARQREAERQKRLEEERLRQLAMEEERGKETAYQELMEQARQCYKANLWDEAISKAEAAAEIFPERREIVLMIEQCKDAKEVEEYLRNEQMATSQKFSRPLAEVIKDKTSVGNLIGTTAKWLKTEGNTFGETEYQALLDKAKQLPLKEQKKMRSKTPNLQNLQKAIGVDMANRLLSEMGV